jgi:nicotinamide riboside kinase
MATINVDATDITVCLTGPESSGKSTLARQLAAELAVPLVEEVARDYLSGRLDYTARDVLHIAELQVTQEQAMRAATRGILICDTDISVIQIWWQEKYGDLVAEVEAALAARSPRVYLLLEPDLPWQPDPLRENPDDRQRLFDSYVTSLEDSGFPFRVVAGQGEARFRSALASLAELKVL